MSTSTAVTDEAAFQDALDRDPSDHHTRRVFADWLDERGDPRAEGYRLLGTKGRRPFVQPPVGYSDGYAAYLSVDEYMVSVHHPYGVPQRIWDKMGVAVGYCFASRREAEDCAARAFARLPAERRAELLSG